jgi:hypothetical protein
MYGAWKTGRPFRRALAPDDEDVEAEKQRRQTGEIQHRADTDDTLGKLVEVDEYAGLRQEAAGRLNSRAAASISTGAAHSTAARTNATVPLDVSADATIPIGITAAPTSQYPR